MPSSASRACQLEVCGLVMTGSADGTLEVGHGLVGPAGTGQHGDQLPPVDAPGVEDRLGVVDEQRDGGVLPLAAGRFGHARTLAQPCSPASTLVQVSPDPSPVRLHVGTGKGGTGKTTVAAALALALAADGRSVLLVETEGRQGIAQLFDTPPLPYEERRVAVARGGGVEIGRAHV